MDKIFSSVTTPEGMVGVALVMAFVLVLVKPVRTALTGGGAGDPIISMVEQLAEEMARNTEAIRDQQQQFRDNNVLFERTLASTASIQNTLTNIHTELVRGNRG